MHAWVSMDTKVLSKRVDLSLNFPNGVMAAKKGNLMALWLSRKGNQEEKIMLKDNM